MELLDGCYNVWITSARIQNVLVHHVRLYRWELVSISICWLQKHISDNWNVGNDLARVLRWGPGYTGGEDPLNLLRDVIDAEEIRLDRWTVVFHPEDKPDDSAQKAPSNATGKKKKVHQAQTTQQNQHQTAAITSNPQGHLVSKILNQSLLVSNLNKKNWTKDLAIELIDWYNCM